MSKQRAWFFSANFFLGMIFCNLLSMSYAQQGDWCGYQSEKSNQSARTTKYNYCLNGSLSDPVSVAFHFVWTDKEFDNISSSQKRQLIESLIDEANLAFSHPDHPELRIQFQEHTESFDYRDDESFYQSTIYNGVKDAYVLNAVPGIINVFIQSTENDECGSFFHHSIRIQKRCPNKEKIFVHELGHYFKLEHTHNGYLRLDTKEFVIRGDGENCTKRGDFLCSTAADPKLSRKSVAACTYVGKDKDPMGNAYEPHVENHMSYSPARCRIEFTLEQRERMYANLTGRRNACEDEDQFFLTGDSGPLLNPKIYPNPIQADQPLTIDVYHRGIYQASSCGKGQVRLMDMRARQINIDGILDLTGGRDELPGQYERIEFKVRVPSDVASGVYMLGLFEVCNILEPKWLSKPLLKEKILVQ